MADRADVLVVCGPTATGKTALAVRLAELLDGEIISADSMQIYRGLCVGTAQPTAEEMRGIPHHLINFLAPEERFSVADYVRHAAKCIEDITARGRVPIVAGGTGLYISSLVNGIDFTDVETDFSIRQRLQKALERDGAGAMHERLRQIDPAYAAKLHPANAGRVLRALEWYEQTGETMTSKLARSLPKQKPYNAVVAGITFPERAALYARVNARVDEMLARGLLEEARTVFEHRDTYLTAAQAIGYKEFFPYFAGDGDLALCVDALKQATRRYAKRQLTWFRRMEDIAWYDAAQEALAQRIVLGQWARRAQGS